MISRHSAITVLLRSGKTLVLDVSGENASVGDRNVGWNTARRYVKRLRNGNQPELARQVLIEYPDRKVRLVNEGTTASK